MYIYIYLHIYICIYNKTMANTLRHCDKQQQQQQQQKQQQHHGAGVLGELRARPGTADQGGVSDNRWRRAQGRPRRKQKQII